MKCRYNKTTKEVSQCKIAIDIGGTNIKVAVINDDLEMIDYKKIKTPDNINVQIVDETYQLVAAFMKQYQLKNPFIGISVLVS